MLLLKNGKILENGKLIKKDILVEGKYIKSIKDEIELEGAEVLELNGKFVSPGFIDVHVHWREPGFEYKESIYNASRAAARGGFTTAMPMPNLDPVPDTYENLKL
ncbi:amidohydrolase family protein, partial [Streptococcus danieliae]|nr:amidohydrolase family protein [Streptococcus danieliae]